MVIAGIVLYGLSVLFVGTLVYAGCDPYGHISQTSRWCQTILYSLFWPFVMMYIIAAMLWYGSED